MDLYVFQNSSRLCSIDFMRVFLLWIRSCHGSENFCWNTDPVERDSSCPSIVGIGAIWYYNEPLTREVTGQLKEVDVELALAQATLKSSEKELQRALRIVDATQEALEKLTQQSNSADSLLENIQSTLDDRLLPELKTTRVRIEEAAVPWKICNRFLPVSVVLSRVSI